MTKRSIAPFAALLGMGLLAGCASDGDFGGSSLTTAAVPEASAPKVDPACVTLAAQIDTLRKETAIENLQKASEGKTPSVQVKRASLAKQAELNKANADFQARCSTIAPKPSTAAAPAPVAKEAAAAAAAAGSAAAPAKVAAAAPAAKTVVKKAAAPANAAVQPAAAAAAPGVAVTVPPASTRTEDVLVTTVPPVPKQ